MKSHYFCDKHAQNLMNCEAEAYRCWSQTMGRGVKAYGECRVDAAEIYLGSALDIALLRCSCESNTVFSSTQIIKPAELLIELLVTQEEFERANRVLKRICNLVEGDLSESKRHQYALAKLFVRAECAEKNFFGNGVQSKHRVGLPFVSDRQ